MATTKLKGNEVTLSGTDVKVGDVAPVVTVVAKDFAKEFNSKEEFLNTLYSIDLKTK